VAAPIDSSTGLPIFAESGQNAILRGRHVTPHPTDELDEGWEWFMDTFTYEVFAYYYLMEPWEYLWQVKTPLATGAV
jgi:hypothetical protein